MIIDFEDLTNNIFTEVHIIELKPSVGEDYPNILRKMINQSQSMYIDRGPHGYKEMELWNTGKWKPVKVPASNVSPHRMYLILQNFNSMSTEFEELKQIYANLSAAANQILSRIFNDGVLIPAEKIPLIIAGFTLLIILICY